MNMQFKEAYQVTINQSVIVHSHSIQSYKHTIEACDEYNNA